MREEKKKNRKKDEKKKKKERKERRRERWRISTEVNRCDRFWDKAGQQGVLFHGETGNPHPMGFKILCSPTPTTEDI